MTLVAILLALRTTGDPPILDASAYRKALEMEVAADLPFSPLSELAGATSADRGRPVAVRGTVRRVFRSAPTSDLPALYEAWLVDGGQAVCVVGRDDPTTREPLQTGRFLTFRGTLMGSVPLKDSGRAAVIVGPRPATEETPPTRKSSLAYDSYAGGVAVVLMGIVFARWLFRRPKPSEKRREGAPEFLS